MTEWPASSGLPASPGHEALALAELWRNASQRDEWKDISQIGGNRRRGRTNPAETPNSTCFSRFYRAGVTRVSLMIVSVCAGQRLSSDTNDRSDTTVRLRARFDLTWLTIMVFRWIRCSDLQVRWLW
jgi:hypothetical protein